MHEQSIVKWLFLVLFAMFDVRKIQCVLCLARVRESFASIFLYVIGTCDMLGTVVTFYKVHIVRNILYEDK